jgi:hypothetical protein
MHGVHCNAGDYSSELAVSTTHTPPCAFTLLAGYKGGMELPPTAATLKVTVDITQFGAIPNNTFDNTQAFMDAIASAACQAAAQCVVYIPPGTWTLQQQLIIRDAVILRGAGRDRTTLYFPFSLKEIKKDLTHNAWFGDRLLTFRGSNNITYVGPGATRLANITQLSKRGSLRVYVDSTAAIRTGQQVRVVASDHGEDGGCIGREAEIGSPVPTLGARSDSVLGQVISQQPSAARLFSNWCANCTWRHALHCFMVGHDCTDCCNPCTSMKGHGQAH